MRRKVNKYTIPHNMFVVKTSKDGNKKAAGEQTGQSSCRVNSVVLFTK